MNPPTSPFLTPTGPSTLDAPTLVMHVRHGYDDRRRHIEAMLGRMEVGYEFFLDGDADQLTPQIVDGYFGGYMATETPGKQSCAYKHLLACHYILAHGWEGALILEDDISLKKSFPAIFNRSMAEQRQRLDPSRPAIISYDGSMLRFVPGSQRRQGQLLYPGPHDRYTGAYWINAAGARAVAESAAANKIHLHIDKYHTWMLQQGLIDYWWCQPAPAVQGSFDGTFGSALNERKDWHGGRPLVWALKTAYRKLLFRLR